jgi:sugar phosphate isomerase/epimerase
MFDIGHATIEGGLSWPIEARLMERHLTAVFVKDFRWEKTDRATRMQWAPLGEGQLTMSYFDWLKKTNFNGPICQHAEYNHGKGKELIANLQRDLKVLREWLS